MRIVGTAGDDVLTGTVGPDTFILTKGGDDTALGSDGDDIFNLGRALTAADRIRGGAGHDFVVLRGDYSAGLTLGPQTLSSIARIVLKSGFSYDLTADDETITAGAKLKVSARALTAGESFHFDGRAETDGAFRLVGGAGDDVFTLGGAAVGTASKINGGSGQDTVILDGDWLAPIYPYYLLKMTGVETLSIAPGHYYRIQLADTAVAAGQVLTIDGSALETGKILDINATAETDGGFHVIGGAGQSTLYLSDPGALPATSFQGGSGNDVLILSGSVFGGVTLPAPLVGFDALAVTQGAFDLTSVDANVAAGATLIVFAANDASLAFDGHQESDGHFHFTLDDGVDTITGGALGDTFDFTNNPNSHGSYDILNGFDFKNDLIEFRTVNSVETVSHQFQDATWQADLADALSDVKPGVKWAKLIQVAAGSSATFAGGYFLVVSDDTHPHTTGYGPEDLLLFLSAPVHTGQLDVSDFIA